jgi:hypothetical protein
VYPLQLSFWCAKSLRPSTIVYPREQPVSEGSLYPMAITPPSHPALSTSGSTPASNSNSLHPRDFTGSSLKSLAHSSSVSSVDRRLSRRSPGDLSPPLSATGRRGHRRSHSSNLPQFQVSISSPQRDWRAIGASETNRSSRNGHGYDGEQRDDAHVNSGPDYGRGGALVTSYLDGRARL